MNYQDTWIKGDCIEKGERECYFRYRLLQDYCSQYRRPFTVLDVGASLCYFGVRLTEDFPECTVIAIEHDHADEALHILRRNDAQRVILLRHRFSLDDLRRLAEVEAFDVILALSVMHRFEAPWPERFKVLKSLGDNLIAEIPDEDCTGGAVDGYERPEDARNIGFGMSHLVDGHFREILALEAMKMNISKAYLDSPRDDLRLTIYSEWHSKRVHFYSKDEERDWLRGINLQTYLKFGGCWPEKSAIAAQLEARGMPEPHRDIQPWNVIIQGDDAHLIDSQDKNMEIDFPDAEHWRRLVESLRETA